MLSRREKSLELELGDVDEVLRASDDKRVVVVGDCDALEGLRRGAHECGLGARRVRVEYCADVVKNVHNYGTVELSIAIEVLAASEHDRPIRGHRERAVEVWRVLQLLE